MPEFDIIKQYFRPSAKSSCVAVPNGDDAAVLTLDLPNVLSVSRWYQPGNPDDAKGSFQECQDQLKRLFNQINDTPAQPVALLMNLVLPEEKPDFLEAISQAINKFSSRHHLPLIGGDTTSGNYQVTFTIIGQSAQP